MTPPLACLPAIDLQGGRCVRLLRGDFSLETVYGDPLPLALAYVAAGASGLHLVDLDAARTGQPRNRELALAIAAAAGVPVQLGGGIRSREAAEEALASGVDRVVVGTAALEQAGPLAELAAAHPGRMVLGLDYRRSGAGAGARREVAVRGWQEGSGLELLEALERFEGLPLAGVLATDISVDGTLEGPDLAGYEQVLAASALPLVASGGVGTAAHLASLARLSVGGRMVAGVVVGRALLSGALTLEEAVAACER